ncbi:vitamin K epoxide reductase family protein [Lacisediminihabitans sp. G11-30]|uniref:Vitamin K epoxide reductase family protein n=2 Tax=Lacisediminihabitans changchengi TaxID=2787634 RepID=A0A934SH31_9MICO|nr:vitamin K epoxide reductase family protein [Lacisediminihabitans changchengi]
MLALGVAQLAGAELRPGWWLAITPLAALGAVFELWVIYLAIWRSSVTPFFVIQVLVFIAIFAFGVRRLPRTGNATALGIWLVLASSSGFFAAIRLVTDKVGTFVSPDVAPSCNVSVLVQCGKNLSSPEGSVFGFPNPLIGVGGWIAVLLVGVMVLAGLKFARWFWIAFNLGMLGALVFIIWLINQSIFHLGTLCPWCMTTWVAVIPTFLLVTFFNLKEGRFGGSARARSIGSSLYSFVPLISLLCFVVIFLLAQVQLDVITRI